MLGEFVPIIRALALVGIDAQRMWDMELWEIAAALGVGAPRPAPAASGSPAAGTGRDLIAERIRAHKAGLPPPEPSPEA